MLNLTNKQLLSLFIHVRIALCTILAHNTAQNRPDNFPSHPPNNHHLSDDVYLRQGGRASGVYILLNQMQLTWFKGQAYAKKIRVSQWFPKGLNENLCTQPDAFPDVHARPTVSVLIIWNLAHSYASGVLTGLSTSLEMAHFDSYWWLMSEELWTTIPGHTWGSGRLAGRERTLWVTLSDGRSAPATAQSLCLPGRALHVHRPASSRPAAPANTTADFSLKPNLVIKPNSRAKVVTMQSSWSFKNKLLF